MSNRANGGNFYRRGSFWKKTALGLAGLFILYLLGGFFLAPRILHSQLEKQLALKTGRDVTIQDVRVNPLRLSATIVGFRMRGSASGGGEAEPEDLASFESLLINLSSSSIWNLAPVLDQIGLREPKAWLARRPDGSLSFDDVIQKLTEAKGKDDGEGLPRFLIHQFDLVDGAVFVRDEAETPVFEIASTPINFSLLNFGLLGDDASAAELQAQSAEGARIEWEGSLALRPIRSEGRLQVTSLNMSSFEPYLDPVYAVGIAGSQLNLSVPYSLNLEADELLSVTNANVQLRDLQARLPNAEEPFFQLASLDISGINLGLTAMQASIERITFDNGSLLVERLQDGQLALLGPRGESGTRGAATAAQPADAQAASLRYSVESIIGSDFALRYVDSTFAEPLVYPFLLDDLTVGRVSDDLTASTPIRMRGSFDNAGKVNVEGALALRPLQGSLSLTLEHMPLQPLSTVAASMSKIGFVTGEANAEGNIRVQGADEGGLPLIRYQGVLGLDGLNVAETANADSLLGFTKLRLTGVDANSAPLQLQAEELHILAPRATVQRFEDGNINLLQLVSGSEPAGELPINVTIARSEIREGAVSFEDQSTSPHVSQHVQDLDVTVRNFALSGGQPVDAEIRATVGQAPFQARARWLAGQYFAQTELTANLQSFGLQPLSPYAAMFIGHSPLQGDLLLDLAYAVDGAQLNGSQSVRVSNLSIGPRLEDTEAPSLPVDLAVSLLKDRNGVIALNVPISGDVGNPQFSFADVIATAFSGVVIEAIIAPFALIASLFGDDGDTASQDGRELSFVAFESGTTNLPASELSKISTLARALFERPQLAFSLHATPVSEQDRQMLSRQALRERLLPDAGAAANASEAPVSAQYREAVIRAVSVDPATNAQQPLPSFEKMEQALLGQIEVPAARIEDLLKARQEAVSAALLKAQNIEPTRITAADGDAKPEQGAPDGAVEFLIGPAE